MKVKQFIGPFNDTVLNLNIGDARVKQIGIECPKGLPWAFDNSIPMPSAAIQIDDEEFIITELQILEFEGLQLRNPTIIVKNTSPYVVVDIGYE